MVEVEAAKELSALAWKDGQNKTMTTSGSLMVGSNKTCSNSQRSNEVGRQNCILIASIVQGILSMVDALCS